MYFSKVRVGPNIGYLSQISNMLRGNGYSVHQALWKLFSNVDESSFLYREEIAGEQIPYYRGAKGEPIYYVVSEWEPVKNTAFFDVESKEYNPKLTNGERLTFKLRANPVRLAKKERTPEEIEAWRKSRLERGLKEKEPTKKRIRHDVVMEAKKQMGYKELPPERRPYVSALIQEAGFAWLKEQEANHGFFVAEREVRADGYNQHKMVKRKGKKLIQFSTLDFDGILTVTDVDAFIEKTLFKGLGPAKAFGCGLMLVRRIRL